ncbi:MAG: thiol-disulfide isomerase [Candidatus Taylorbacteria bacterium CG11_big_fil_rev_8_21_14_0_20_46_11]|uniref:Thiol-disulfide isomerase n=1 Tax=Candidatus Taylorbacteria bacterium CG11_big_fil_rev_8_21_14_0_20_46_11 TaxID=1975025 RepID=A0A2H0KBT9_9BACT|nr:MAG: thiol-disulfide isomerase [Candidatus Taylorbacteria bacterium CG11_big_fil_rev_8_21_14_0_20_46_11]
MQTKNLTVLIIVVACIVGAIIYLDQGKLSSSSGASEPVVDISVKVSDVTGVTSTGALETDLMLPNKKPTGLSLDEKQARFERAKEITTPDGFINSLNPKGGDQPMTLSELVGKKVILLDIWTYSCINCQRTLPYLKAWDDKYKDKGLVIVGLHTPEFEFEKVYANVLSAVKKFEINYPVVLDNDYSTWHAYKNQYWPRKYLIDIDGFIIYDHIGEGGYEETERQIQKALAERAERLGENNSVTGVSLTKETSAGARPESPEIYFGASRNQDFGNGTANRVGVQTLSLPSKLTPNLLYLGGSWNIQNEYAESTKEGDVIEFRYKAKDVYFVASSKDGVRVKIYQDGELVQGNGLVNCSDSGFCGGDDVAPDGSVYVRDDRLYKLIENPGVEEHVLKIEVEQPGLKAFTFTFG